MADTARKRLIREILVDAANNPWAPGVQDYGRLDRGHYTAGRKPPRAPINVRGIPTLTDGGRRKVIWSGARLHRLPLPIYKTKPSRYS